MSRPAFTLMEILVYLALAAIVLGVLAGGVYSLTDSSGRERAKILLENEAQFLRGKFDWAFLGARGFTLGAEGTTLTVNFYNSVWPAVFSLQDGHVSLAANGQAALNLNADAVEIDSLLFRDVPPAAGRPEGIDISVTARSLSGGGQTVSLAFTFSEYLKQ